MYRLTGEFSLTSSFPEVITACFRLQLQQLKIAFLKLIKNYLRTSIRQGVPSDLSILSTEIEKLEKLKSSSAMNAIINKLAEKK